MEVVDPGVQIQERLSAFSSSESLLTSLLSPCGSVFLLDDIVPPGRGDHLLVVDALQARDFPDRGSVATELIGMDDLWNVMRTQQPSQESLRRFSVPMPLKENVQHETVLVHGPPEPVADTIDARAHLILSANSGRADRVFCAWRQVAGVGSRR